MFIAAINTPNRNDSVTVLGPNNCGRRFRNYGQFSGKTGCEMGFLRRIIDYARGVILYTLYNAPLRVPIKRFFQTIITKTLHCCLFFFFFFFLISTKTFRFDKLFSQRKIQKATFIANWPLNA